MQTSTRRANVTARGRGVVRWLPWVAQLLRWAPWGHQVTHATPIPGLPANVPVQVRQDLYTDHLWHVVNNAGIWGRSGFRTAEAAERFARRVVIDRDGTEYRRNQPGVPPGVYHGEGSDPAGRRRTDEPDPRPSEELYQAMLFVARERFGPGVAERITRTVIRHNELSREIDAAYERGDHDAAEALEPQAEALREELEGLYHELEHGREDYHDLVAGVDEELAALYADYLANRLSLPRNATPEEKLAEVVSRARSIIDHHAWNAGLNGDRVNERITDDQVLEAMESAYRIRREHVERGRERQRTKRKSDLSAARKFARKAKRKRRRNPIPIEDTRFFPGELKAVVPPRYRTGRAKRGPHFVVRLYVSEAALDRLDLRHLIEKYTGKKALEPVDRGEPGWLQIGRLSTEAAACDTYTHDARDMAQVLSARVVEEFHGMGAGAYLYTAAADEAQRRGIVLASDPDQRSTRADQVWDSERIREHYRVDSEPVDEEAYEDTENEEGCGEVVFELETMAPRRRNPKGGGKWAITEHDQALASWGLAQLRDERLDVVLVPSQTGEGKIRVAVSANPEFYRRFLDRRRYGERKKQRSPGYRKRVTTALQRIVDDNPVRRGDWVGWELLELLRELEAEQLGGYG